MRNGVWGFGIIIIVVAVFGYLSWSEADPGASVPLAPGFEWQQIDIAEGGSLEIFFCSQAQGSICGTDTEERIELPKEGEISYRATIEHSPPVALVGTVESEAQAKRFAQFHSFYKKELTALGYVLEDIVIPGGYLSHGTYEKLLQTSDHYGRVRDGQYQLIVVRSNIKDSSDCEVSKQNIFGGCNVNAAEYYTVTMSAPIDVSALLEMSRVRLER